MDKELSTAVETSLSTAVDEGPPQGHWLGLVVPKKHAKRSVTRSLLKRRIRVAVLHAEHLDAGMWVVRLRSPFPRTEFSSAASEQLGHVASVELAALMSKAASTPGRR